MPGSDRVYPNVNEDDWQLVPAHIRAGIADYVQHGQIPGGFLQAVIRNNLSDAAFQADVENYPRLGDIAKFIYWHTPNACQGSEEKMLAWKKLGGLEGLEDAKS